jgi:hypothetical protein
MKFFIFSYLPVDSNNQLMYSRNIKNPNDFGFSLLEKVKFTQIIHLFLFV